MWTFLQLGLEKIDDKTFHQDWNSALEAIKVTARTQNLNQMLELSYMFPKEVFSYWDLDVEYRWAFEEMTNYPPAELFEDKNNSDVLHELRVRCYNAGYYVNSKLTPTLNDNMKKSLVKLYNGDPIFFDHNKIQLLNTHEVRLLLEIYVHYVLSIDENYKIDELLMEQIILQIGK